MSEKVIIRPKHREVLKKLADNVGLTRQDAMQEVGYTKDYAEAGHITDTDSWQRLMDEYLPDELLAEKHKELLNKREIKRTFQHEVGEWVDVETNQPDTQAVKAGLDMGYKLKGKYTAEKHEIILPKPILDVSEDDSDQENKEA